MPTENTWSLLPCELEEIDKDFGVSRPCPDNQSIQECIEGLLGCGITRPLCIEGGDLRHSCGEDIVRSAVGQVLGTMAQSPKGRGELPWRTEFGSKLYLLQFSPFNQTFTELARLYAEEALRLWEPRVNNVRVYVEEDRCNRTADIHVEYCVITTDVPGNNVASKQEVVVTINPEDCLVDAHLWSPTPSLGVVSSVGSPIAAPCAPTSITVDPLSELKLPSIVTGSGSPGDLITVSIGGTSLGSSIVDSLGNWAVSLSGYPDGNYTVAFIADNLCGATAQQDLVLDVETTVAPFVSITAPTSGTKACPGDIISGTHSDADTVEVFINSISIGMATIVGGTWSIPLPTYPNGTVLTIDATAVNVAGSATSSVSSVTYDASTYVSIVTPSNMSVVFSSTVFAGTAEPGTTVELKVDSTSVATIPVGTLGTWSWMPVGVTPNVAHTLQACAVDDCGNTADTSVTFEINDEYPGDIISKVDFWYEASDVNPSGVNVTDWPDRSGNNSDLSAPIGSEPTYINSDLDMDGFPTVCFNGTSSGQMLEAAGGPYANMNDSDVFFILRSDHVWGSAPGGTAYIMHTQYARLHLHGAYGGGGTVASGGSGGGTSVGDSDWIVRNTIGQQDSVRFSDEDLTDNQMHGLHVWFYQNNEMGEQIDNAPAVSGPLSNIVDTGDPVLLRFGNIGTGVIGSARMYVAEMIKLSNLTAAERSNIRSYLASKYPSLVM